MKKFLAIAEKIATYALLILIFIFILIDPKYNSSVINSIITDIFILVVIGYFTKSLEETNSIQSDNSTKYAIIPISFKDYNEYVDKLNQNSKDGWEIVQLIRVYENSPYEGLTTHDYICVKNF